MSLGVCVCVFVSVILCSSVRPTNRSGAAAIPNDGHYSPLSDAGARSMKLRQFSPGVEEKRGGKKRGEEKRGGV